MPFDGNQPSPSENTRISTSPSQKVGMLLPNRAPIIASRSNVDSGRVAETTPAETPSTIASTMLAPARMAVFLNRSSTIVVTGARSSIDRPRSPRNARSQPVAVLNVERLVQPEILADQLDLFTGRAWAGQHLSGIPGDQLHQQENDDADAEQDRDGRETTPDNKGAHGGIQEREPRRGGQHGPAPTSAASYPIVTVLNVNMYEFGFTKPCTFLFQARAPFWWQTQIQAAISTARCSTSK